MQKINYSRNVVVLNGTFAALFAAFAAGASPGDLTAQEPTAVDHGAANRIVLITGSTDGLGREVALALAAPGTHIIVHGRNQERGDATVAAIREAGATARFYRADFASLDAVRDFGTAILADYDRIDVLVNNAGIALTPAQGRLVSADGHELHFAVNYLSHYLLTHMLIPRLRAAPAPRIVNVSSAAQRPIDFDDVMIENGYDDMRGYAQSKLAQVLFTIDLAAELEDAGIKVNALHPATMMNTTMVAGLGVPPRSDVSEGVAAVMNLIESPGIGTGGYYFGIRPVQAHGQAYDEHARARLRAVSDSLTRLR